MKNQNRKNFYIGLSGGVDSAVAAWRLVQTGASVTAVFMQNWDDEDEAAGCHDKDDLITAAAVADSLGIEFVVANFAKEYKESVFVHFTESLQAGRTPNPDVLCNAMIKFAVFCDYARAQGADAVATGHYAQTRQLNGEQQLLKGEDANKDQTYFLHQLTQAQLAHAEFPLATLHKSEVRQCAKEQGLSNWARKDSVGICFIGKRPFNEFIAPYVEASKGDIVDIFSGNTLGTHDGLPFYTIGQRKGLRIGGMSSNGGGNGGQSEPWFVAQKDMEQNRLLVVKQSEAARLAQSEITIENPHWISHRPPSENWVYSTRLRHRQPLVGCVLSDISETQARIKFSHPQLFPAPGQYAVLYDGNLCLGGGIIQ